MMKLNLDLKKGWEGYLFFTVLAIACIVIGATNFKPSIWAGIFSILVGLSLLAVTASLILRKR